MADEDLVTYDDDKSLGTFAPSLELLEYVRGERIDYIPGKVHVVYFWAKYYKGGLMVGEEITQLSEKYPNVVFIGISADAQRSDVEKFLASEKIDGYTGKVARLNIPYVCYDDKSWTRKLFQSALGGLAVSVPQGFIIDQNGKIAWRQVFSQSLLVSQTDFEEQLKAVSEGKPLKSHGPKPKKEAGFSEPVECDDMSLF
eukprot:PhF_6_TR19529/c0_g1_i1/m.28499